MQNLLKCLVFGLIIGNSLQLVSAQEAGIYSDTAISSRSDRHREKRHSRVKKNLFLSRAVHRARLRVARIESRKRRGYSPSRPVVWGGQQHSQNLNTYTNATWLGASRLVSPPYGLYGSLPVSGIPQPSSR